MARLAISKLPSIDARAIGGVLGAKPRVVSRASEAAIVVAPIVDDALLLGAFQRARSTLDLGRVDRPPARRTTGGVVVRAREGQLFVALDLRAPEVLGGVVDPNRALNRHVRPLLRALSTLGDAPATFGGRDFVGIRGSPVAFVAVTEDGSRAMGMECVVAVDAPFGVDPSLDLATGSIAPRFLGKNPATLRQVFGRSLEANVVAERIVDAYAEHADGDASIFDASVAAPPASDLNAPPFDALVEEAMGLVGAIVEDDTITLGGEVMARPESLRDLGRALFALGSDADDASLGAAIDRALGPSSSALFFGVRSLKSIATLVRAAWKSAQKQERASH